MTESDFRVRWQADRPIYAAWGLLVRATVEERVLSLIDSGHAAEFFKIVQGPRAKDEASLVEKAFYRSKPYSDPYHQITDKVGIRFVVLLGRDIRLVERGLTDADLWTARKDRDYESERLLNPLEFAYQSVHYVVFSAKECEWQGTTIPAGVPCEIQIRTLLQHAHCELTHDTVYKPKTLASAQVHRTVAKSMALIEATDDCFERVVTELEEAVAPLKIAWRTLDRLYTDRVGSAPVNGSTGERLLDEFSDKLPQPIDVEIHKLLEKRPFISEKIRERRPYRQPFRDSSILLAYFLASKYPSATRERWPLDRDTGEEVFTDMSLGF
ncbi:GTP pyrophosphokinase family protein [Aquincola sp. J276]|uniref:GTP pyrophosphokinase n=1 Tax=Aquincola sp. J276 TaxID=2898432 RepID=UPI002150C7BE|nr:RelA/SpoT domain-containing protein [Aquincola sp. J276]MCR5868207.1 RelA/SpoT domain-containing protein [Aquincola sp. J276]